MWVMFFSIYIYLLAFSSELITGSMLSTVTMLGTVQPSWACWAWLITVCTCVANSAVTCTIHRRTCAIFTAAFFCTEIPIASGRTGISTSNKKKTTFLKQHYWERQWQSEVTLNYKAMTTSNCMWYKSPYFTFLYYNVLIFHCCVFKLWQANRSFFTVL